MSENSERVQVSPVEDTHSQAETTVQQHNTTNSLSSNAKAFSIDALLSDTNLHHCSEESDSEIEVDDLVEGDGDGEGGGSESSTETDQPPPSINSEDASMGEVCRPSESLAKSKCHLEMTELWKKFHELGTEMIITKSGRRMFPSLRISFTNLDPKANYHVFFDIAPVDNKRYRYTYHRSSWLVAGRADPPIPRRVYTHPDGPFRGDSLMKQSLSFEKVKLTNNLHDKWGYVILNSMHKYQPRVHLVKYDDKVPTGNLLSDLTELDRKSFTFPETQFIGVTAYQNQLITKLKIDSNPFAKGFRDSARITQIDRESVDLLIKASRHGYPQIPTSHMSHQLFPDTSQSHIPILPNPLASKYPTILPLPVPNLTSHHDTMSKELIKAYLDRLAGSSTVLTTAYNKPPPTLTNLNPALLRFNPYKR